MSYQVIIDPADPNTTRDGIFIENVLEYCHQGSGVFYVAGTDFEQWFVLHPGQIVSVTQMEKDLSAKEGQDHG